MTRLCSVLLLCLLSLLAYAGPKEDAIAKRKNGDKLMAQGDFNDALKSYDEAKALYADPEFDLARGEALLKLRRYQEAQSAYQFYLDNAKNAKSKNDVKKAMLDIDRILKTSLSCQSDPAGAVVYLNSRVDGEVGPTPVTFNLPPGTHRIIFIKDGFRIKNETVTINEGEAKSVSTKLEIAPYTVDVTTTPSNAEIFINGEAKAKSPAPIELSEGAHNIELKLSGFQTFTKKVEGKAGEKIALSHTFVENPSQLLVTTEPPAVGTVEITGKETRGTIGAPLDLPPGKYNVIIKANGFKDAATVATIEKQKTTESKVTLEPYPIKFAVQSNLTGFTLLVDGKPQPLAGGSVEMTPGEHNIRLEAPKKDAYSTEMTLNPGESLAINVNFKDEPTKKTRTLKKIMIASIASSLGVGVLAIFAADGAQRGTNEAITARVIAGASDALLVGFGVTGYLWYTRHKKEGKTTIKVTKTPAPAPTNP